MSVQLIRILSRALSWLPLRANQSLGMALGRFAWLQNGKLRRITEVNIRLCYPKTTDEERRELARRSLIETGRQLTECAWIWHRPIQQIEKKIVEIRGNSWLDEAQQMSKTLKKMGFKFTGPMVCMSLMQAVGVVNHHVQGCHLAPE